jgi:hypothetical protein
VFIFALRPSCSPPSCQHSTALPHLNARRHCAVAGPLILLALPPFGLPAGALQSFPGHRPLQLRRLAASASLSFCTIAGPCPNATAQLQPVLTGWQAPQAAQASRLGCAFSSQVAQRFARRRAPPLPRRRPRRAACAAAATPPPAAAAPGPSRAPSAAHWTWGRRRWC